jgi:PAS domain S-box-containing protein
MSLASTPELRSGVGSTILVIEDDLDDCQHYRLLLRATLPTAHCIWAHTAAEGFALMRAFHPHCILLDFRLPDLNGLQFLEALRGDPPERACTVVMVTAHRDETLAIAALRSGAFDYLVKDVEGHYRQALPAVLDRALEATAHRRERDQEQHKFAELARRHETIINSLSEGIVIAARDFSILAVNPAVCKIFGYEAHELIGENMEILTPAKDRPAYRESISQYWKSGTSPFVGGAATTAPGLRKDGSPLHIEWSIVELRLESREALAVVIRDVSEREIARSALVESDARFRGAFENAPIGMALGTADGRFLRVNSALESTLGYSESELVGRTLRSITHPEDSEVGARSGRMILQNRLPAHEIEIRLIRKDGHIVWASISACVVRDESGKPLYLVGQFQDITERKNTERRKSEFLAMVSHELRTPLTAIRGALSLIANEAAGELPPKAKALTTMAQRNSERLSRLIADILDMERIEAGGLEYHMQPVELYPLLEESIDELRAYGEQYHVRFELSSPDEQIWVHGDPDRLIQVMANLLSNAAKFSRRGGVVTIATEVHDGRVRVCVTDHGKGIPESFQKMVFHRFAQADAVGSARKGGTGLGLSISKAIVEKHGGSIGFSSLEGVGTTFHVELPLSTSSAVATLSETGLDVEDKN